jgi:hypothetical protein
MDSLAPTGYPPSAHHDTRVAEILNQMTILRVEELGPAAEADKRISSRERTAAIIIPGGFSAGIDAYQPTQGRSSATRCSARVPATPLPVTDPGSLSNNTGSDVG